MATPLANQTQPKKAPNYNFYSKLLHILKLYSISRLMESPSFHVYKLNTSTKISPKSHKFHCLLETYRDPGCATDTSGSAIPN